MSQDAERCLCRYCLRHQPGRCEQQHGERRRHRERDHYTVVASVREVAATDDGGTAIRCPRCRHEWVAEWTADVVPQAVHASACYMVRGCDCPRCQWRIVLKTRCLWLGDASRWSGIPLDMLERAADNKALKTECGKTTEDAVLNLPLTLREASRARGVPPDFLGRAVARGVLRDGKVTLYDVWRLPYGQLGRSFDGG